MNYITRLYILHILISSLLQSLPSYNIFGEPIVGLKPKLLQCKSNRNPGEVGLPEQQCLYAIKVVDREALAVRKKLQRAEMEKEILGMLDHPFLPTLYAEFEASHYSCLVMEFCPGGDLYAARLRRPGKRFPISTAKYE